MLPTFTFKVGLSLSFEDGAFDICKILEDDRVQLESHQDGSIKFTTKQEMLDWYANGKLKPAAEPSNAPKKNWEHTSRALSTFPEEVQKKAIRKMKYLQKIAEFGPFVSSPNELNPLIELVAKELGDPTCPSACSVWRWHAALAKSGGDYRVLIDRHDRKGGKATKLKNEIDEIMWECIDDIYMTEERHPIQLVHDELVRRIDRRNERNLENIESPSYSTISRAIKRMDAYEVEKARYGKRLADIRYRYAGRSPTVERVMELVETDHTLMDVFVIDAETNELIGRPTLTTMLCKASKVPVGMFLGFQGPCAEAVLACLKHAITPKTYVKERFPDIKNDWPCYGMITYLLADNGLEFHGQALERAALEVGTSIGYCPPREPYFKGSIERYQKTMNYDFARLLPGHSFASWLEREDYDPLKHAVIPLDALDRLLHKWIIDVYMQKVHRGLGMSPIQKWNELSAKQPPQLVTDLSRLEVAISKSVIRTVSHAGINLHGIRYNDRALETLRKAHGKSLDVEVRYLDEDVSYIYVTAPESKTHIVVPALDQESTRGVTLLQHKRIREIVRQKRQDPANRIAVAKARAELAEEVRNLLSSKRIRKTQRAAKMMGLGQGKGDNYLTKQEIPKPSSSRVVPDFADESANELIDLAEIRFDRVSGKVAAL